MSRELETLLKISQIVLGENNIALREDVYCNLIMAILSSKDQMTFEEIRDCICKDLGLQTIPDRLINDPLERMVEKKEVIVIKIEGLKKYFLGKDLTKKITILQDNFLDKRNSALRTLESFFREKSGKKISRKFRKKLKNEFDRLLGLLFYKKGVDCANSIMSGSGVIPEALLSSIEGTAENIDEIEISAVDKISFRNLNPLQREIISCIRDKNEEFASYLFSLAQSYYLIQALHIDPECQQFCLASLQNKKIYLDTNCILYLFIDDPEKSEAIRETVMLSKDLGVRMYYTQETKNEYLQLIKHWKSQYSSFSPMPYSRFQKIQNIVRTQLLADFTRKHSINPKLTWNGYFIRLEMFDSLIEHFATLDETSHPTIYDTITFNRLQEIIHIEAPSKSVPVQRHDAYHILFIEKIRNETKSDYLGPSCWFLTFDRSLDTVEKEIFTDKNRIPYSILVDQWLAIISPLIAPRIPGRKPEVTFSKLFVSSLPIFGDLIEERDIVISHGDWMDTTDLEISDIAEIYGDKRTREILRKVWDEPEKIHEIQEFINKELKIVAETIVDQKVQSQKATIGQLQRQLDSLEEKDKATSHQIKSMIQIIDNDATRFAKKRVKMYKLSFGVVIAAFLIIIPILCILILPTNDLISLIIGLLLNIFSVVIFGLVDFYTNLGIINAQGWWESREKNLYNKQKQDLLNKYKLKIQTKKPK